MWSIIAASVVDLPEPVVPVSRTIPRGSSASLRITSGRPRSSIVRTWNGIARHAIETEPALAKGVDAEPRQPGDLVGEVHLALGPRTPASSPLVRSRMCSSAASVSCSVSGSEPVDRAKRAVDPRHRRRVDLDVQVGALALNHVAQRCIDVECHREPYRARRDGLFRRLDDGLRAAARGRRRQRRWRPPGSCRAAWPGRAPCRPPRRAPRYSAASPEAAATPSETVSSRPAGLLLSTACRKRSAARRPATGGRPGGRPGTPRRRVGRRARSCGGPSASRTPASRRAASPRACPWSVVDLLEAVEVGGDQADRAVREPRLLVELGEAQLERLAVQDAGERVEHRLGAVVELRLLERVGDRDHAHHERHRRDQVGRWRGAAGVDGDGGERHQQPGRSRLRRPHLAPKARRRQPHRHRHPGQRRALAGAREGDARRRAGPP